MQPNNKFSYKYYSQIIEKAKASGYAFFTVGEFLAAGCPDKKCFVLRHDLDAKPASLPPLLDVEKSWSVRSTVYVRVTANDYNTFDYMTLPLIMGAERDGFEVGLHSNFVEFAEINRLNPMDVLKFETNALRSFVRNNSIACHRDFSYMYNSLPWLEENWDHVKNLLGYSYQPYDSRIMNAVTYINEGYHPHLCWRNSTPEDAIETGHSICMMTHPHFWWENHPFEAGT